MTQTKLFDKVYGAVMGFAAGDALGVPVEEMHYKNIKSQYGQIRKMLPVTPRLLGGQPHYEQSIYHGKEASLEKSRNADPFGSHDVRPGSYSDDTRYLLLCAKAVIHYQRRITSLEFAEYLAKYVQHLTATRPENDLERLWATAMFHFEAIQRIASGRHVFSSLYEICTGWDGIGGLINPFDPHEAALDGGPISAGVATALLPDATVDQIVGAVRDAYWSLPGHYCEQGVDFLQNSFVKRMDSILDYAARVMDPEAVIEELYRNYLVTFPPYNFLFPLEMIPAACAIFKACKGNYADTVSFCAAFGRDCDGTAAMGGQLAGALYGASSIPQDYIQAVNSVSPVNIPELCNDLYLVIKKKLDHVSLMADHYKNLTE